MSKEIRATGLSKQIHDRWTAISELLGTTTNSSTMSAVVNLVYLLYCAPHWPAKQRKAAALITAQWAAIGSAAEMHWSSVKSIREDASKVLVYTKLQGEPYLIRREDWDRG